MCDYCDSAMFRKSNTSTERLEYRLRVLVAELRRDNLGLYRRGSVADALESMMDCEEACIEREVQARKDALEMIRGFSDEARA